MPSKKKKINLRKNYYKKSNNDKIEKDLRSLELRLKPKGENTRAKNYSGQNQSLKDHWIKV